MIPCRAASDGSPATANEREQKGRNQQPDAEHFYSLRLLQPRSLPYPSHQNDCKNTLQFSLIFVWVSVLEDDSNVSGITCVKRT